MWPEEKPERILNIVTEHQETLWPTFKNIMNLEA